MGLSPPGGGRRRPRAKIVAVDDPPGQDADPRGARDGLPDDPFGSRGATGDGASPPRDGTGDDDPFHLRRDPGWRPRPGAPPDGLVTLRFVFLAFCSALLVIGVVVGILTPGMADRDRSVSTAAAAAGVVVAGLVGLALVRLAPVRMTCDDELALARSWRSRFFGRMAASELPALAGFVAFSLTGAPALYPLGLLFTAAGFAWSGPFHATLVRDQAALARDGCAIPLLPALQRAATVR